MLRHARAEFAAARARISRSPSHVVALRGGRETRAKKWAHACQSNNNKHARAPQRPPATKTRARGAVEQATCAILCSRARKMSSKQMQKRERLKKRALPFIAETAEMRRRALSGFALFERAALRKFAATLRVFRRKFAPKCSGFARFAAVEQRRSSGVRARVNNRRRRSDFTTKKVPRTATTPAARFESAVLALDVRALPVAAAFVDESALENLACTCLRMMVECSIVLWSRRLVIKTSFK